MAGPWTEQPVLEGRHVRLRPMVRTDGPAIVEAASDGRLWELFYTAVPGPDSIDSYLDRAEREQEWGRVMPFVVIEKVTGSDIATQFGISRQKLHALNDLDHDTEVTGGTVLVVPRVAADVRKKNLAAARSSVQRAICG